MKRERVIALVAAAITISGAAVRVWVDYATHPRLVTGPMVQMIAPDGWTLAWDMHPSEPVTLVVRAAGEADRTLTVSPASGSRFEATITGLRADRDYHYDIGPGLAKQTVRTAPATPRPFRVLALGDTGDGEGPQWRVARQLPEYAPDLIVHTGDLVYPNGNIEDYPANFYRPYADLIAQVPFYPCLGNHDVIRARGSALLDSFVLPRNGPPGQQPEQEYWFDYADVRFVALNSNQGLGPLRDVTAPWLDHVLADAGSRWTIVFFHEPIYTHGKYQEATKLRDSIGAILDRHHVNLVLCGHNHMYERTHPLHGGQIVPPGEGTIYVTTGAGGAGLYKLLPRPPEYLAFWDCSQHGFTIVDVSNDLLHVRQVGQEHRCIDEFFIPRPAPEAPRSAETPTLRWVTSGQPRRIPNEAGHRDTSRALPATQVVEPPMNADEHR